MVVERAHRGEVEQQYAHVLWLAEGLAQQHPTDVLLRGAAAGYALDAPVAEPLRLADRTLEHPPDYRDTLGRMAAAGVRLLVSRSSLAERGLGARPLLAGIDAVSDEEIATICARYDRIWYL